MRVSSIDWRQSKRLKVTLCFLLISVAATLFNIGHSIDGFVLKHISMGYEVADTGSIPENSLAGQIPGFYSLLSMLLLVTGIDSLSLTHFPIQLVPYSVAFFTLCYVVSRGNIIIPSVLTGLQLFISSSATWRLYLWPHGIGTFLFFVLLLSLIMLFRADSPLRFSIIIFPCSVALVYISYNLTAIFILLLVSVLSLTTLSYLYDKFGGREFPLSQWMKDRQKIGIVLTVMIVTGVAILLSDFLYTSFLPLLRSGLHVDSIYQFLVSWISSDSTETTEISHLLTSPPDTIRYLAILRYIVIFSGISGLFIYVYCNTRRKKEISAIDAILLSYVSGLMMYFFVRAVFVDSVAMSVFYIPGVLALAFIFYRAETQRLTVAIAVLLVILSGTILGTQIENNRHDRIDRNIDAVYHADNEQEWIKRYNSPEQGFLSDEMTKNLVVHHSLQDQKSLTYMETSSDYRVIEPSQAAALTVNQDPGDSQCFILNNHLQSMSLHSWQIIHSWDDHLGEIESNRNVSNVYTEGELQIICS